VADILKFLNHIHGNLRKLILENCWFGQDSTVIANIVDSYPDLEVLSLEGCFPFTDADYCLLSRLKNLSELKLPQYEVEYVCVKPLETPVCIRDSV
jgi:hypothetical protein